MGEKRNLIARLAISVFLVAIACGIAAGEVIYVDADASGGGDGSSWTDAYNYLQDALAVTQSGDEIWVAEGTYTPDANGSDPNGSGDRTSTFQLINGVAIKGGYAGFGEPDPNGRAVGLYETILSGDIGNPGDETDNSYNVVTGSGTNATAVLDGFTITAGNASGDWPSPTALGGGMYNDNGSPTVTNCTFNDNSAYDGGGMYNDSGSPTVTNCMFSGNAVVAYGYGGGMCNYGYLGTCRPRVTNCTFIGNSGTCGGGMNNSYSRPTITNCTFSKNSAMWGGGMYNDSGIVTVTNCIFWGNSARSGPEIFDFLSTPTVTYSDITGGYTGTGNIDADPLFVDANGPDDIIGTEDDDLRLSFGSLCIDAGDNDAVPSGIMTDIKGEPRFVDDHFTTDTGNGTRPIVDIGAYEYYRTKPVTIYVDANAIGANNGWKWDDAFNFLQDALDVTISGDEIRVAEGIYTPDANGSDPNGSGDRTGTFQLINGAAIKGGYAGFGEPDPNARDIATYETILSGDLDGNDVSGDPCTVAENSYHVVTGSGTDANTILDGFTIMGGNADAAYPHSSGSGMFNNNGSPTVTNCTFSGNWAQSNDGGGMFNYASNPTLTNCTFNGNSAGYGGGGMCNDSNSSPTLTNCTFSGNAAGYGGGGMCNDSNSSPTLTNCTFSGNAADANGGGMYNDSNSSPMLTNCTFSGNAAEYGGGIYNDSNSSVVTNCILWGNTASWESQIYNSTSPPTVTYSDVQGGYSGTGNIDADPLFVDADGPDDIVGTEDDNLQLSTGSPCIDAGDNTAVPGGVTTDLDDKARFIDGPLTTDTGNGTPPIVDMGAYEYYAGIIFVDADATGANDGSNWANAYNYLQDALADANSNPDVNEIWVAQGTYKPDANSSYPGGTGDREATFRLINDVGIYGGFASTEISLDKRDWRTYETIMSGDINTPGDNSDNSYHIVTGSGTDANTILDGFTITGGHADAAYPHSSGGGMLNDNGSPTVTNCTFSGNWAQSNDGGGMFNYASNPTLTNCTFNGNSAGYGGGGMCNDSNSSPMLTNCTFSGNAAGYGGGGMCNDSNSSPTLTNCTFSGNSAGYEGGGMSNDSNSSPTLTNCTFSGNVADANGGGIYNDSNSPVMTNCILWGNTASLGSQIYNSTSSPTVTYSDVEGGYSGTGNIDADPLFVDANGPDDIIGTEDDDLRLSFGSLCIDAGDNDAVPSGIMTDIKGEPRFVDDYFTTDTGNGTRPIVDIGAYEYYRTKPVTIYVDANATGANGGLSWDDAFNFLQDTLDVTISGDEIRIAEGIYTPDANCSDPNGSSDRTATFQLINGAAIRGGYAGFGEPDPNARDIAAYETILSGDIGAVANSYHVVTGSGTDANTILDGFTITGGHANAAYPHSSGSGMFNDNGSPTVTNCTFSGNWAQSNDGGGMFNYASNPTLTNCTFNGNSAGYGGGGMCNDSNSSPTLTNCTFTSNSAWEGGGIHNDSNSSPLLTNCTFSGNVADANGGGMWNHDSSPTLTNCTFTGNSAAEYGGGMYNLSSSPMLTNCTFSGNSAEYGGGIYNDSNSSPTLTNCTFSGNAAEHGGGIYNLSASPTLNNCILWGNSAPSGPEIFDFLSTPTVTYSDITGSYTGTGNIDADPLFVDANGPDGIIGTEDDNLQLSTGSLCIDAGDNTAVPGGVTTDLDGKARFIDGPLTIDTGNGIPPIVDMGAYEYYAGIVFVDADATGANDGSNWANAYNYLQDALADANSNPDVNEIWVAQGTYKPDANSSYPGGTGDREATFQLINDVGIYGGFAGTEISLDKRDWRTYETIMSGDINTPGDNSDNSYHIVTGSGTDANTILDGFTITGGHADAAYPHSSGSGMFNDNGSPTVTNCTFSGNWAQSNDGGGMFNYASNPTLTNCTFNGNSAGYGGGGMCNDSNSSPTLTNCTFSGNAAGYEGGGMCNDSNSSPTLTNCTFSGNVADANGGGIYNDSNSPVMTNCILWGNTASLGSQIYNETSPPTITYSDVQGGYSGTGNIDADPLFVDANGPDDIIGTEDDDLRLSFGSPCIDAGDNNAVPSGIMTDLNSELRFVDDHFTIDTGNGTRPIVDIGAYEYYREVLVTIYVDANTTGANDGLSWDDAFNFLQDALDVTISGDEIRVAEGIYTPDANGSDPNGSGDRTATFQLINGVAIKGGYAGFGQPDPNARDVDLYVTILSGDLDGNDVEVNDPCDLLTEPTRAKNSYNVVTGSGTDANAVLDGFTITAGNADGSHPDPCCYGGGMYNDSGSPTLTNCTFSGNLAEYGSGLSNRFSSSPTLTNCTFSGNAALGSGGMDNENDSNSMLVDCTFTGNYGSGMANYHSSPTLTSCTFTSNSAWEGGGMYNYNSSSPTLTNCTFSKNSAVENGGGMWNHNSNPTLVSCTFSGNSAAENGGGISNDSNSSPMLTSCTFSGNSAWDGGGISNDSNSSPTLTSCTFTGNSAAENGGGMFNSDADLTLTNCTFSGNAADANGGGMYNDSNSSPLLTNCTFSGNSADMDGGGMYNDSNGSPLLTNCTFNGNAADANGGGIYNWQSSPTLTNCILWADTPDEIYVSSGTPVVTYCDLQGGRTGVYDPCEGLIWGVGNIDADPCFAELGYWADVNDPNIIVEPNDPNAVWVDGDYHLKSQAGCWDPNSQSWVQDEMTSPCIDAGNPGAPLAAELRDANNVRVNMGAYGGTAEASKTPAGWAILADLTNDGIVYLDDLAAQVEDWLSSDSKRPGDLDRNGIVNMVDFALFAQKWSVETSWHAP